MTYFDREKVSGNSARSRVSEPSEDVNELYAIANMGGKIIHMEYQNRREGILVIFKVQMVKRISLLNQGGLEAGLLSFQLQNCT